MTIVDAHLHVWRTAERDTPLVHTIVPPQTEVPIELAHETMAEHGVDRAVLVQPVFRGEDNHYIADCARAEPNKFAAVCVVDPRLPGADSRLVHWVSRGCRGLRLRPRIAAESAEFGDPSTYPLWDAAQQLCVVISLLADMEHVPAIGRLAERFAEVPIVVDHLGHPNIPSETAVSDFRPLLDLARHAHVYVKLSGFHHSSAERFPYADCRRLIHAAHEHFGAERLIWGSDFPHVLLASGYAQHADRGSRAR